MKIVKIITYLFLLALCSKVALAEERIRLETPVAGNSACKYVDMVRPSNAEVRKKSIVSWDGNCVAGYVSGNGVLQIQQPDGKKQIFRGNYQNGLEDGVVEMISEEPGKQVRIQGVWKSGTPQYATVEITKANGKTTIYKGELKESQFVGHGEIKYEDGTVYTGNFADNQPNGYGKAVLADGRVYEGEHLNGKPNGRGIWLYKDGGKYEGNNFNGMLHGKGKIYFSNGDIYEGDFENGVRTGKGIYKWVNGRIYSGEFQKNKIEGYGKYTESNGDFAEGNTKDGKLDGNWIVTKSNNQKYLNEYHDGVITKQSILNYGDSNSAQSQGPDPGKRQKGIDHMYCSNYAQQMVAGQRPAVAPGGGGASAATALLSGALIGMNRQEAYDNCMKNLGW